MIFELCKFNAKIWLVKRGLNRMKKRRLILIALTSLLFGGAVVHLIN